VTGAPTPDAPGARRVRARRWLLAVAVAGAVGLGAAAWLLTDPLRPAAGRQVVVVMLDAARADRLSCMGYDRPTTPALDALAAGGLLGLQHYSHATATLTALPPFLYSRYFVPPLASASPEIPFTTPDDLFRDVDAQAVSLPRALAGAGFRTAMISAHIWLKPWTAFATEFEEVQDLSLEEGWERRYHYPRAERVVDAALAWLERHRGEDVFLYLHVMDTHHPHFLDEDARGFLGEADLAGVRRDTFTENHWVRDWNRPLNDAERRTLDALYDGDLRHADRELGRLFERLRPDRDRTLVVVTADHGEHLLHVPGRFAHGGPWYETVARVPFIVSFPAALRPARLDFPTEAVDILPTVLGLLDVPLPPGKTADGRDLSELLASGAAPRDAAFANGALRVGDTKCIFHASNDVLLGDAAPRVSSLTGELYDLARDPLETQDLWEREPGRAGRCLAAYRDEMRTRWDRYSAARRTAPPPLPFALEIAHARPEGEVRAGQTRRELAGLLAGEGDWMIVRHRNRSVLVGRPGGAPLRLHLPVPDGLYRVSLGLRGRADVEVDGAGHPVRLDATPLDPLAATEWPVDQRVIGSFEASGRTLPVVLRAPPDGAPLVVFHVGFEPQGAAASRAGLTPGELESLRALGYVE
jgi:arylsulfatase A-like enzyme